MIIYTLYILHTQATKTHSPSPQFDSAFLSWSGGLSGITMGKTNDNKRHQSRNGVGTSARNGVGTSGLLKLPLPLLLSSGYMSAVMAALAISWLLVYLTSSSFIPLLLFINDYSLGTALYCSRCVSSDGTHLISGGTE